MRSRPRAVGIYSSNSASAIIKAAGLSPAILGVDRAKEDAVTASVIVAAIFMAGVIYWFVRSQRKQAHHLDNLHIAPKEPGQRKKD